MVRKMPSKLSRQKGQNLKPFLLTLMANVLADSNVNSYEEEENGEERGEIECVAIPHLNTLHVIVISFQFTLLCRFSSILTVFNSLWE